MKKTISFFILFLFPILCSSQILFNQLGYYTNGNKEAAAIDSSGTITHFRLISAMENNAVKYEGQAGNLVQSKNSSKKARLLNFSNFMIPGTYKIQAGRRSGNRFIVTFTSESFKIEKNVLHDVSKAVLKSFYYQRASTPILPQYAGIWSRPIGHPDNVVYVHSSAATNSRPTNTVISTPGGWYDAGDYNKYTVSSSISVATLLSAYEDFPNYFKSLDVNIPETGNGLPDILNEAAYNLRWMLTVQDPNDGGVYHKTTSEYFPSMRMPVNDTTKRWVIKKNTAASLDFAAVMAQAYRVYKQFPQSNSFADSCLLASSRAWDWAKKNPYIYYSKYEQDNVFKPPIVTGACDDGVQVYNKNTGTREYHWNEINDEWFWAACELYLSTSLSEYKDMLYSKIDSLDMYPPLANHVQIFGCYSLLRLKKDEFASSAGKKLTSYANYLKNCIPNNAFGVVMGKTVNDFLWGSNFIAANQSVLLLNAYKFSGNKDYFDAAITNIDYVLGKNPTEYCFITGFGSKSPKDIYHSISYTDGIPDPIPGLLAGGPYKDVLIMNVDKSLFQSKEPELLYVDHHTIAPTNENCISYNSAIVYALNAYEYYMHKFTAL